MIYPASRLDRCRSSITTSARLLARSKQERARALTDPVFASEKLWEMTVRGQVDMADLSWDEDGIIHGACVLAARLRYDPVIAVYTRSLRTGLGDLQTLRRPPRPVPRPVKQRHQPPKQVVRARPRERARSPARPDRLDTEADLARPLAEPPRLHLILELEQNPQVRLVAATDVDTRRLIAWLRGSDELRWLPAGIMAALDRAEHSLDQERRR